MKKVLSLLLVLCLLAGISASAGTVSYLKGDVDGDGRVTTTDALLVLRHITGTAILEGNALKNADFDNNGKVDTEDVVGILRNIAGFVSYGDRLLYSTSFEDGFDGWEARGNIDDYENGSPYIKAELTTDEARNGNQSLHISGRTRPWQGAILDITDYLRDDLYQYEVIVWVKLPEDADPSMVYISFEAHNEVGIWYYRWSDYDAEGGISSEQKLPPSAIDPNSDDLDWSEQYIHNKALYTKDGWVLLHGYTMLFANRADKAYTYVESDGLSDIYIDDFTLLAIY